MWTLNSGIDRGAVFEADTALLLLSWDKDTLQQAYSSGLRLFHGFLAAGLPGDERERAREWPKEMAGKASRLTDAAGAEFFMPSDWVELHLLSNVVS